MEIQKVANSTEALNVLTGLGVDVNVYLPFRLFLEALQESSNDGDEASQEILSRVCQVANLVLYVNNKE